MQSTQSSNFEFSNKTGSHLLFWAWYSQIQHSTTATHFDNIGSTKTSLGHVQEKKLYLCPILITPGPLNPCHSYHTPAFPTLWSPSDSIYHSKAMESSSLLTTHLAPPNLSKSSPRVLHHHLPSRLSQSTNHRRTGRSALRAAASASPDPVAAPSSPFEGSSASGTPAQGLYSAEVYDLTVENVDRVLDDVRPYLISDGGNVDVVSVEDGVISLKLQGLFERIT